MKHRQQAAPEFTTDADGQELAHVALANTDRRATLYAEDYQRLMANGFSPFWALTGMSKRGRQYPSLYAYTAQGHNRAIMVARLITCAPQGQRVEPRDGDALNMRAENLELVTGTARFAAADWHPTAAAAYAVGAAVRHKPRARGTRAAETQTRPKLRCRPVRPTESTENPKAPHEPAAAYTPRTLDRTALSARVRETLATSVSHSAPAPNN